MSDYPSDFKYTKEHEWLQVNGKTAAVGLTDFAQKQYRDIVRVDVESKEGTRIEAGEPFVEVEAVKTASEFYSPVSGKVVAVNAELSYEPENINDDPHTTWIIKIEMSDVKELDQLMNAAEYEKYIAGWEE